MERIGFIGLGAMGGPMAKNLVKKGFGLTVFDVVTEKMEPLKGVGAEGAASGKEVAEKCPIIITMLPSSPHVNEAVLGPKGIFEGVQKGSVLIDMSTIDPITTREIARILEEKGVEMLDAPVARGVPAAVAGTLVIYVGGEKEVFDRHREILAAMGTDIYHVGDIGTGEVVKIVNNLMVAVTTCALAEAMVLGVKAGVKPDILFEALSSGSGNSFVLQNHYKNNVMKDKFEEGVFPVDYMLKDLNLALSTGNQLRVPLHFAALSAQQYILAGASGESKKYHPAVIRPLEKLVGVEVRSGK
ncbi:MAG: NAD(P)-dependent oxidoreductase [Thermodesulfobacteriota bacterium]|jgi:3-hydroxyisobutyrate dehydrogenase